MTLRELIFLPAALPYGLVTKIRNLFFDWGVFRSTKHPVKIISVGNLSHGGTGKTPHVEYLIRLLNEKYSLATLSRGYGRKTKGYILAGEGVNAHDIGDEPLQYYKKFKDILVVADESRNHGAETILKAHPDLDYILLDDAFQHRWIQRDLNIMLTDFHHLFFKDCVAPSGRLREFKSGYKRADIIIVSKCPVVLSPITRRHIIKAMRLKAHQKLIFSKIIYDGFFKLSTHEKVPTPPKTSTIVLFTGIANSYPLQEYLQGFCNELAVLTFPDHHDFKEKDIRLIDQTFEDHFSKKKILVTTEKDAQRLGVSPNKDKLLKHPIFYIPIRVVFHNGDEEVLQQAVKNI